MYLVYTEFILVGFIFLIYIKTTWVPPRAMLFLSIYLYYYKYQNHVYRRITERKLSQVDLYRTMMQMFF